MDSRWILVAPGELPRSVVIGAVACGLGLSAAGCGSSGSGDRGDDAGEQDEGLTVTSPGTADADADADADGTATVDDDDDDTWLDADDDGPEPCTPPVPTATLEGRVFAPNMTIPISGALVYTTKDEVEPVPPGVYCAECVTLSCDTHFVLTEPDGTFSLPAVAGTGWKLVVQKGQFLRVFPLDIEPGTNVVPPNYSSLPGSWNPAQGMWIPRIAVFDTSPDRIFNVLAKFGLGQVNANGTLVPGTEQFTMISGAAAQQAVLDDLSAMNQYHIIFVPCAATKFWPGAPNVPANRVDNVRAYVAAGGKWYATDHSNEYISEPFPAYQTFHNPAMPDLQPAYTSVGTVVDPELLAWLQALPPELKDIGGGNPNLNSLPSLTTLLNYSGIDAVHPVIVQNDEGEDVDVGHHVWVEGPCGSCSSPSTVRPMAVSGQYGCGRMMFSTFETSSSAHAGLNPQELVLLYMILEIGVCFDETPPPPPPAG